LKGWVPPLLKMSTKKKSRKSRPSGRAEEAYHPPTKTKGEGGSEDRGAATLKGDGIYTRRGKSRTIGHGVGTNGEETQEEKKKEATSCKRKCSTRTTP